MERAFVSIGIIWIKIWSFKFISFTFFFFFSDTENYDEYGLVEFKLTSANLTSQVKHWKTPLVLKLGFIKILGFFKPVKKMTFNGKDTHFDWDSTSLVS